MLKVVEEVLINVLGEKAFTRLVKALRRNFSLEWHEIPSKSDLFSFALKEMLGIGSTIIEDLIIENLYLKLGQEIRWRKDYKFSDYIKEILSAADGDKRA
ncbi:MAG: hypothetical protein RMJ07_04405 [Nitrososphaerota archaeon]|nr:hypothetical protein [Candidatus Bathyarchaeota archaeon]MDW8048905.1 hypothetical protein [Nitrososphaerota archaeon]